MALETILLAWAKDKAKTAAIGIATEWVKTKGETILGLDKTEFAKTLENTIYETIKEFDTNFPIADEGKNFAFYKSELLIQALLSIKFINSYNADINQLEKLLSTNPNIISPKRTDILKFVELFEKKCKDNPALIQHQFNNNYKEAIFAVLDVVEKIQTSINKVIAEMSVVLKGEYLAQMDEIQTNINSFKPKTALERIEGLEKRVSQNNLLTPDLESKLLYLKGACILETGDVAGAEWVVRAYIKTHANSLMSEACVAYLNLKDDNKAKELVDKILEENPYNGNAWFIQVILSKENYLDVYEKIPATVKSKRGFIVSIAQYLLRTFKIDFFEMQNLGLEWAIDLDEKITHANITLWEKIIHIELAQYFSAVKEFSFDESGKLRAFDKQGLDEILYLLKKFFNTIKTTEIFDKYPMLRFYYSFIRHLMNDETFDKDELASDYAKLKSHGPQFDLHYAEYLANSGDLEGAIKILNESKFNDEDTVSFHKIIYTKANKRDDEAKRLIQEHINIIEEIDFAQIFNLTNLFRILLPSVESIKEKYDETLRQKRFQSDSIKNLFKITILVNYLNSEINQAETQNQLYQIGQEYSSEKAITFYIAQLLYSLQGYDYAAQLLKPFIEEGIQNELNLLYSQSIYNSRKNLPELLKFLEKLRLNNTKNIYGFLALENNLRQTIDDSDAILDISWRGVKQYPEVEYFHVNLVSILERKELPEQLKDYVTKYFKPIFDIENNGVWVSTILIRTGFVNEGSLLLYNLASTPTNYTARRQYLTTIFPPGFFIQYSVIEEDSHVKLVGKKGEVKLLKVKKDDRYNLIGKKREEITFIKDKTGYDLKEFKVERIMNAQLFLFESILEQAKDSESELGVKTKDFGNETGGFDIGAFEKHFIEQFGPESDVRGDFVEEFMQSYFKGDKSFTEVCRQVFNDNPLECYKHLTRHSFFSLPAFYNSNFRFSNDQPFAIDFTTLVLLSDLQTKYGIKLNRKFIISTNLTAVIRSEIIKLESSPASTMSINFRKGKIQPFFYPENYHQTQIDKYKELLSFLKDNCEERVIEEKVEFLSDISEKHKGDTFFNCMVDNAMFCTTLGISLISNDTFIIKHFGGLNPAQISPELFLLRYFKGTHRNEMMEYFIQNNYVGVLISKEILLDEYRKKQLGHPNAFNTCITNLKFRFTLAPVNLNAAIKFLKEVYLSNHALDNEKFLLAQTVFISLLDGNARNGKVISLITVLIYSEFQLMGEALDKISEAFETALAMYGN